MTIIDSDDFNAFVAHELGNPIAVVGMAAASLDKLLGDRFPEARRLVRVIADQAAHSGDLLSGLLELSRAERAAARDVFDLAEVVDHAALGIEGLVLDNRCAGTVVVADRLGVRQAVANLLSNAARHGRGEATAWCVEAPHGWRVLVGDRGPGLDADEAARVFRAFERGRRADEVRGSGLGLAVVAAMAKAHGGDTGWTPRPGGGSIFWFTVGRRVECPGARPAA